MLFIRRAYIFLVCRNPLCLADAFTGVSLYSPSGCRPTMHLVVIEPVRLNDNFLVLHNITLTEVRNRRHCLEL